MNASCATVNSRSSEPAAAALQAAILRANTLLPAGTTGFVVAYSGGCDSTALLHALHALWPQRVRAVHVHHGLHPDADDWASDCRRACAAAGIPLELVRVHVVADGTGPEAAARTARYRALQATLAPGEVLATAHHADDQAETVLFRLLRGGGANGARGLRALRRMGEGWLWRPLLDVRRAQLERYCHVAGLRYVTDPQNTDGSNVRGRLRGVLADCESWVPGASEALCALSSQLADQHELLALQLDPLLAQRLNHGRLDIRGVLGWSRPLRHALLRRYCAWLGLVIPGPAWLARCDAELLGARADATPTLTLGDATLRRFDHRLWVLPELSQVPTDWYVRWRTERPLVLPGDGGSLHAVGPGLPPELEVRFVQPGEQVSGLRKRFGSARLKAVFHRERIPPWERRRTPVVIADDRILQVGAWWVETLDESAAQAPLLWEKPCWHRLPEACEGPKIDT